MNNTCFVNVWRTWNLKGQKFEKPRKNVIFTIFASVTRARSELTRKSDELSLQNGNVFWSWYLYLTFREKIMEKSLTYEKWQPIVKKNWTRSDLVQIRNTFWTGPLIGFSCSHAKNNIIFVLSIFESCFPPILVKFGDKKSCAFFFGEGCAFFLASSCAFFFG